MKKNFSSQSGFFNPRIGIAVILTLVSAGLGWFSFASTPSSGALTPANPVVNYDAGPLLVANQSPVGLGQVDSGPRCNANAFQCDSYNLSVVLPAGYIAANPNASLKVTLYWTDTGAKQSDYDLYVYDGVVDTLGGNQPAPYSSASGANPEVAVVGPLHDGTTQYTVKIVPYTPTAETVHVKIELLSGTGPARHDHGDAVYGRL